MKEGMSGMSMGMHVHDKTRRYSSTREKQYCYKTSKYSSTLWQQVHATRA